MVTAAKDNVGLEADAAQLFDAVLGRLGFQFSGGRDIREKGHVNVQHVLPAYIIPHLPYGLEEGETLDVADGASDLNDHHIGATLLGQGHHSSLDLIGDMGDGLNCAAEVVAPALLGNNGAVNGAGGYVGFAGEVDIDEAFVVAEVEVGLAAVLGNENLAVLVGGHSTGVDVEVGVELLYGDVDVIAFENSADGGDCDALTNRANDAASDEYEFSGQYRSSGHAGAGGRKMRNGGEGG